MRDCDLERVITPCPAEAIFNPLQGKPRVKVR
jgi:hypothetical protein